MRKEKAFTEKWLSAGGQQKVIHDFINEQGGVQETKFESVFHSGKALEKPGSCNKTLLYLLCWGDLLLCRALQPCLWMQPQGQGLEELLCLSFWMSCLFMH